MYPSLCSLPLSPLLYVYGVILTNPLSSDSLGTRYTLKEKGKSSFAETQMTLAYNHLGRVKTTYTTALLPFIFMSARYTVNVHSFRSNTAIGVECWPSEH